jgi:regulator of sigma E protease
LNFAISIAVVMTLVFIHELGHAALMRKYAIPIKSIAVGLGPLLWSRHWSYFNAPLELRLLPFGGYVQPDQAYRKKMDRLPWLNSIDILGAGVHINLLAGFVLIAYAAPFHKGVPSMNWGLLAFTFAYASCLAHEKIRKWLSVLMPFVGVIGIYLLIREIMRLPLEESLGGPIAVIKLAADFKSIPELVLKTAVVSLSLAAMNLLPLGILDGGQILRSIMRRLGMKRAAGVVSGFGTLTLLVLITIALWNDITGLLK